MEEATRFIDLALERPYRAFFSTRHGGVSPEPYKSLNLGLHVGDVRERVIENRRRFFADCGLLPEQVVAMQQVHGDNVVQVSERHCGMGSINENTALAATDGLVTVSRGVGLVAFYADCVPVLLYDRRSPVLGLCHAGWKGTALKIVSRVVDKMVSLSANKNSISAIIGPSICGECYEVSEDVADQMRLSFSDTSSILVEKGGSKYLLDLRQANRQALRESGVEDSAISVLPYCTCCHKHLFFSHRRDRHPTGRMALCAVIE